MWKDIISEGYKQMWRSWSRNSKIWDQSGCDI